MQGEFLKDHIAISRSLQLVYFLMINALSLEQLPMELLIVLTVVSDFLKLNAPTALRMVHGRSTQETFVWLKSVISGLAGCIWGLP